MNLHDRVLQLSGIQITEARKASEVPPAKEPVNNETHIHAKEFFDKIEDKIDSLMDQGQKTVSVTSAYASKPDFFVDLKKLLDGKYEGFEFDVKQIESSGDDNKTKESLEISWEKKKLTEGFETHVLCSECGSGDLELSKLKTKIRCTKCGNVGLTESIVGLNINEMARTVEEVKANSSQIKILERKIDVAMDDGKSYIIVGWSSINNIATSDVPRDPKARIHRSKYVKSVLPKIKHALDKIYRDFSFNVQTSGDDIYIGWGEKLTEGKSMKLGGGGRFAKLKGKLKGKVSDPGAVAAAIGRKKYGAKKMASMAAKGKKRASKNKMENC